jgi:2-C-methyl-D-erythritol 4-phosphate cytidylyltransferase
LAEPGVCQRSRIQRVEGGAERSGSVLNALLHLHAQGADDEDWVLVHDAARPNLSRDDLDKLLANWRTIRWVVCWRCRHAIPEAGRQAGSCG